MAEQPPARPPAQPAAAPQPASGGDAEYTATDFEAAATTFKCQPWDVAGIFRTAHKDSMTEADFLRALAEWRKPIGAQT